jgi:hypothetical protein
MGIRLADLTYRAALLRTHVSIRRIEVGSCASAIQACHLAATSDPPATLGRLRCRHPAQRTCPFPRLPSRTRSVPAPTAFGPALLAAACASTRACRSTLLPACMKPRRRCSSARRPAGAVCLNLVPVAARCRCVWLTWASTSRPTGAVDSEHRQPRIAGIVPAQWPVPVVSRR